MLLIANDSMTLDITQATSSPPSKSLRRALQSEAESSPGPERVERLEPQYHLTGIPCRDYSCLNRGRVLNLQAAISF